ncbi:MAG: hypothetical protein P8J27_11325, partial [Mariniblastus sp.]|nr:hypothetical protein [Mariniblastus sp.]
MKNLVGLICLFVLSACHGDRAVCQTPSEIEGRGETIPGINVPRGFAVRKVAGDAVASNIYCMAVSPHGDVFVSGPGYIRVLIDSNNDGVFDNSRLFASAPKSGAQGMCFDGDSLLCTGDGGLLRFIDADRDGVSDGPARKLLDIKTGGEHDAHAIRKGPDGWWYLLAGNGTPILPEYSSVSGERDSFGGRPHANPDSPVRSPRAGFLMRISPDWKEKQIYCHGFRNAYDFDFNSLGEVFVFDSDGERDISLPWYQPTRVFRMRAGDDAGWVAAGWKRPDYFFDMPPVIGRLGRGSPTGVVVGSSKQFPNSYRDALFVADWTFGRVVAFRRDANGNYDAGTDFATASGQFGFAVTDLDMAPDGSLLVSVGGRGTEGAIYKVVYSGDRSDIELRSPSASDQFIQRSKSGSISTDDIVAALLTNDSRQCEAALEALVGNSELWGSSRSKHTESPSKIAGSVAQAISQIGIQGEVLLSRFYSTVPEDVQKLLDEQRTFGLRHELLKAIRSREGASLSTLKTVLRRLNGTDDDDSWSVKPLDLVRLGQISLGGCGKAGTDQMFIGYTPRFALQRSLDELREDADQIAMALGKFSGKAVEERLVSYELGRLAAMVGFGSNKLQTELAKRLTNLDSKATEDIHWLNCLSQVVGARSVSN